MFCGVYLKIFSLVYLFLWKNLTLTRMGWYYTSWVHQIRMIVYMSTYRMPCSSWGLYAYNYRNYWELPRNDPLRTYRTNVADRFDWSDSSMCSEIFLFMIYSSINKLCTEILKFLLILKKKFRHVNFYLFWNLV